MLVLPVSSNHRSMDSGGATTQLQSELLLERGRARTAAGIAMRPAAKPDRSRPSTTRQLLMGLPLVTLVIVGTALGQTQLVLAASLGTLALAVLSPASGLVALAFLAPTKPILLLPAPGFTVFLVFAVVVGYIFRLPVDRPRLTVGKSALLVLLIGVYAVAQQSPGITTGFAEPEAYAAGYLLFQFSASIGTVFAVALVLQRRSPTAVMIALLTSSLLVAGLAIVTFDDPAPLDVLARVMPEPDNGARAAGSFGNPNYFGFFIANAMVLSLALLRFTRDGRIRIALFAAVAVLGVGLAMSLSRGGVVALVAGIVSLAFLHRFRTGILALALIAFAALVAYPLFVEFRLAVLTGDTGSSVHGIMAHSDAGRLSAVMSGPSIWVTSPIFGVGFGRYQFANAEILGNGGGQVAHNWYMTVLAEQGLIGIMLWGLLLIAVAVALYRRPTVPRTVGLAVFATVLAGFMFLSPPTAYQSSALAAFVIAAALVADWSAWSAEKGSSLPATSVGARRLSSTRLSGP